MEQFPVTDWEQKYANNSKSKACENVCLCLYLHISLRVESTHVVMYVIVFFLRFPPSFFPHFPLLHQLLSPIGGTPPGAIWAGAFLQFETGEPEWKGEKWQGKINTENRTGKAEWKWNHKAHRNYVEREKKETKAKVRLNSSTFKLIFLSPLNK